MKVDLYQKKGCIALYEFTTKSLNTKKSLIGYQKKKYLKYIFFNRDSF